MDKASGTIKETNYLSSLTGIYEAVIQPQAGDEAIITPPIVSRRFLPFFRKNNWGTLRGDSCQHREMGPQ